MRAVSYRPRFQNPVRRSLELAAVLLLSATSAQAQTTYRYQGAGTTTTPVSGVFSGTAFSPTLGTVATPVSTTLDTLSFAGGTAYTATDDMTAAVSLNSLAFTNTATVTIAKSTTTGTSNTLSFGGTTPSITLGNTATVTDALLTTLNAGLSFTGSGNMTITGVTSGAFGLTMNGTGTIYLNATNTFTGGGGSSVTINSGTVEIGGNASLGATNATQQVTLNGGTLQYNFAANTGSFTGAARGFVLGANGGTIDTQTNLVGIASPITGSGALKKAGSGSLTLTGTSTYTGATTVSAGTLNLQGANATSAITVAAGATVNLNAAANVNSTLYSTSAGGSLTAATAPTLTLSGSTFNLNGNTAAATTQTLSGLALGAGDSTLTVAAGSNQNTTLALGGITRPMAGGATVDFTLTNAGTGIAGLTTTTQNGSGGILGGYATVGGATWATSAATGAAPGALTGLAAYNTDDFTAATNNVDVTTTSTLGAGTTTVNSLRFNTANTATVAVGSGNTLVLNSGGILDTASVGAGIASITGGTLTTGDSLTGTLGEVFVHQSNTTTPLTISSVIADNGTVKADLVKDGAGTLILTGTTTFTGTTYIEGGALQLGNNTGSGSVGDTANVVDNGQLILDRNNANVPQFGIVISGTGSVIQNGTGTFALNATNTYTGSTYLNSGVLRIATGASLGSGVTGNNVYFNGGTLQFAPTGSFGSYPGSTRNFVLNGAGTLDINGNTGTYAGVISGTGGFTVNSTAGGGTITLSGTNTFTGGLTVNAGTVVAGSANAFSGSANTLTINSGTLSLNGNTPLTYSGLSGTGGTLNNNSATKNVALTINQSTSSTFAGAIVNGGVGTLALTKSGAGTLALTGANTYSGGTAVNAGTLVASGTGVGTGAVTIASGATLGVGEALNTTTSSQAVGTLSAASLSVTSASGNATPLLTFNLGASGVSDALTLTAAALPLTFSGAGLFDIGFASATGGVLGAGRYTLLSFATSQTTGLPALSSYAAVPQGNLASTGSNVSNGVFTYTTDGNGGVTGLAFTISGADSTPEPDALALLFTGGALGGGFWAARRRSRRPRA